MAAADVAASAWDSVGSFFGLGNSEKYDAQRVALRAAMTSWLASAESALAQLAQYEPGSQPYDILVSTARNWAKKVTELASTQQAQDRLGTGEVATWKGKAADIKLRAQLAVAVAAGAKVERVTPESTARVADGLKKGTLTGSADKAAASAGGGVGQALGIAAAAFTLLKLA